jgi:hypothetical protein
MQLGARAKDICGKWTSLHDDRASKLFQNLTLTGSVIKCSKSEEVGVKKMGIQPVYNNLLENVDRY